MQNIVLITIDTLRRDHCGCYGYSCDTTPFIDKISSSGVTFEHSFANGPLTTRSFPSRINDPLKSKNAWEMGIAEMPSGEVASAEIVIWDNKRAYRWSAATHTELRKTGAYSLLLFEVFRDMENREFKEINLMAASTHHLAKFISSFNPKLVPYYSVEKKTALIKITESVYHILR